jgi:filamentous hemagglutinin family protein
MPKLFSLRLLSEAPKLTWALFCVVMCGVLPALAAPNGGVVTQGSASISSSSTLTTVTQTSPKAVIQWDSFNLGAGQSINFIQPSKSAIALNRILGFQPTTIDGHIQSNGQIFLINPNGIIFL